MTSLEKSAIYPGTPRLSHVVHLPVGKWSSVMEYGLGSEAWRGLDWWKEKGNKFSKHVTSEGGMP